MSDSSPVKAIASHNGLNATQRAYELMLHGADTLDAAIAGASLIEDDPDETTVGYGGLPNENGDVELDAAVMHGPTHRAGAVAALKNIKNAAQLAQLVMLHSDHVLLVGEGALQFARAHGVPEQAMLSEKARKIWLYWKQTRSEKDDWLPPADSEIDPEVARHFKLPVDYAPGSDHFPNSEGTAGNPDNTYTRPTGTLHVATLNAVADLSCTTTTSGLAFKIPGRVGDSAIIGAGLYVDNEVGSCGSTGRGEANLKNVSCFAAVELMRIGASPTEAGIEVLRRIAANTREERLLDDQGRPNFNVNFFLLSKDGRHAGVSMWGPRELAITDRKGSRLEACDCLYQRTQ